MERSKKETMCVENIGKNTNSGPIIPKGKEIRELEGVLGSNKSFTALTTEKDLEEFSKINEDAEWESEAGTHPQYYKLKITGSLSFNNVCKLIISKNKCVVHYSDNIVTAETIWIGTLNAIGKFLRTNRDEIQELQVWEKNPKKNNSITKIESIDSVDSFNLYYNLGPNRVEKKIQEDTSYIHELSWNSEPNGHPKTRVCGSCLNPKGVCKCTPKNDIWFDVDNKILDTVRTLNIKGYHTFGSCEGISYHNQISKKTNKRFFSGFVGFDEDYNFKIPSDNILCVTPLKRAKCKTMYFIEVDMKNPEVKLLSDDELKTRFLKEINVFANNLKPF